MVEGISRPSWDEYFMNIATVVASRSTCLRRKVGAIVVKDKRILTSGYNGAPMGLAHCIDVGCIREKMAIPSGERHELCRGLHAEQNAIIQGALHGVQIKGATIYSTTQPCVMCSKMILNSGIVKIVYQGEYPDKLSQDILLEGKIDILRFG